MSQLSRFRATVPVAFVVFSILLVSLLLIQADNSRGEEVLAKLEYEIFDDSGETKAMVVNCTNKEEATKATIDAQYNGYDVVAVGGYAFSGCTSLASVDMPNVTTVGSYAFYGCTSLASVDMPNVTTIGDRVFEGCKKLATITVDPNNAYYKTDDSVLYDIRELADKKLILYPQGKTAQSFTIPNYV